MPPGDAASAPAEDVASPAEAVASEPDAAEPVESGAADVAAQEPAQEPPAVGAADLAQDEAVGAEAVTESASDAVAELASDAAPESEAETLAVPKASETAAVPEAVAADGATTEGMTTDGATEAAAASAEPEFVEVWRPGRPQRGTAAVGAVPRHRRPSRSGAARGRWRNCRGRSGGPPGQTRDNLISAGTGAAARPSARKGEGERRSESGGERRRGKRPAFGKDRQERTQPEGRN